MKSISDIAWYMMWLEQEHAARIIDDNHGPSLLWSQGKPSKVSKLCQNPAKTRFRCRNGNLKIHVCSIQSTISRWDTVLPTLGSHRHWKRLPGQCPFASFSIVRVECAWLVIVLSGGYQWLDGFYSSHCFLTNHIHQLKVEKCFVQLEWRAPFDWMRIQTPNMVVI